MPSCRRGEARGRRWGGLGALGGQVAHLRLPYREWTEENQLWVQQVSSTPSTRMDVVHLQEQLDLKLQQRQARETGICPVRRELYSQCFGERRGGGRPGEERLPAKPELSLPPPQTS